MTDLKDEILASVAEFRRITLEFERQRFPELTRIQKDILYAFSSLLGRNKDDHVTSDELKNSDFCNYVSQPTYNRALKDLVKLGYVKKIQGYHGTYSLGHKHNEAVSAPKKAAVHENHMMQLM